MGCDDARGAMYTDIAQTFDVVLSSAERERAERGEVPWLDEVIAELASITTQAHDLVVLHAVGGIIAQRGQLLDGGFGSAHRRRPGCGAPRAGRATRAPLRHPLTGLP
ncbi:hypothetical protein AB0E01_32260 [Nocardia vinacea]|uniref:hypothetical protein n=1 Tax=Nocardia vinacea TaxID=96468 RepID=UPI0033C997B1